MGKCPSCGKKKIFLKNITCNICGKIGCVDCCTFLFEVLETTDVLKDTWYSCSKNCFAKIAGQIENQIDPKEIIADDNIPPIRFLVERVVLKQYAPQVSSNLGKLKIDFRRKNIGFLLRNMTLQLLNPIAFCGIGLLNTPD